MTEHQKRSSKIGYAPIWTKRHTKVVENYIKRCKQNKEKFYVMDRYGRFRALSHEENLVMCNEVIQRLNADEYELKHK